MNWPFDQTENTAALTTVFVLENKFPILRVVHYEDDHSWGFFCGTTNKETDARVISMREAINIDNSLFNISHLQPGQIAYRKNIDSAWIVETSSTPLG